MPIDLGIKIDEDDMVISFLKALEGVDLSKHFKKVSVEEERNMTDVSF